MPNFYSDVIVHDKRFHSKKRVSDPKLLEEATRLAVEAIIAGALTLGIKLMIFETYRSQERQRALFSRGTTQLKEVGVHHYGLACDLVKDVKGNPSWAGDYSFLGKLAESHGLIWGGDWGLPGVRHSFVDNVHVQRCSLADQERLFAGTWYPGDGYDPRGIGT